MTSRRERVPRKVTAEGSRFDTPFELGADPSGNREQRRLAAKRARRAAGNRTAADDGDGVQGGR